jgi:hypothetical protein
MPALTIYLPAPLTERVRLAAAADGRSVSNYVVRCLELVLAPASQVSRLVSVPAAPSGMCLLGPPDQFCELDAGHAGPCRLAPGYR